MKHLFIVNPVAGGRDRSDEIRQKSLPVPMGKGASETFSSSAAPLTHSLKVPSPPQA